MNAYLAATPSQRTPSLFLRYRVPSVLRPAPCAVVSLRLPIPVPSAHQVPLSPRPSWRWKPSSSASLSGSTTASPPLPGRAPDSIPPSPPQPETQGYRLVCVDPVMPPRGLRLPIGSVSLSTCFGPTLILS